jgi:hypothetical protein
LAIRRLALGYDYYDFLQATYADIHSSSDKDLDDMDVVSRLLRCDLTDIELGEIGMHVNDREEQRWFDPCDQLGEFIQPLNWEFAYYVISLTAGSRFDHPEFQPEYEEYLLKLHDSFGHDRVSAMFGSIQRPWEKLSARWQRCDVNGREEWYKDGLYVPRWHKLDY